jgi:TonB family protein
MNKLALTVLLLLVGGNALAQGKVTVLDTIAGDSSHAADDRNPVRTVIPEYPRQAWLEQIEGGVQLCFYVTRGGRPYNIAVRHSDHKVFERPAREAVKISWFEAIPRSEKVPPIKSCRTFQFRLEALETDES